MSAKTKDLRAESRSANERRRSFRESQARLRDVHRLTHLGVWSWDPVTDTVAWNEELFRISGREQRYRAPAFKEHQSLWAPESWARLQVAVKKALESGLPYNLDLEMLRPDGERRWINAWGGVEQDHNGNVVQLHGTVQDMTERIQAEEALRETSTRFGTGAGFRQDGGVGSDIQNGLIKWSPQMFDLFELDPNVATASFESWRSRLHPEDTGIAEGLITMALEQRETLNSDYRL